MKQMFQYKLIVAKFVKNIFIPEITNKLFLNISLTSVNKNRLEISLECLKFLG